MKKKFLKIIAVSCMAVMMFAGCGTQKSVDSDKSSNETVTITDVRGDVEIPVNPERIVE